MIVKEEAKEKQRCYYKIFYNFQMVGFLAFFLSVLAIPKYPPILFFSIDFFLPQARAVLFRSNLLLPAVPAFQCPSNFFLAFLPAFLCPSNFFHPVTPKACPQFFVLPPLSIFMCRFSCMRQIWRIFRVVVSTCGEGI